MKKRILTILALSVLALPLHAQEIEKLSWMTGTWTQNKDGETVQAKARGMERRFEATK